MAQEKFLDAAIECAVARGTQGRAIFSHVKIALRKIVRTLPANFKALLNHFATSHSYQDEKFYSHSPSANFTIKLVAVLNQILSQK